VTSIDRSLLILCVLGLIVSICGCTANSNIGTSPYTSVQPTAVPTPVQVGHATLQSQPYSTAGVQSAPFSISGQVIDASGNPVPGANVTLMDNYNNVLREETTGQNGTYNFLNVVSDSNMVAVTVDFTKDGVAYTNPAFYIIHWYPAMGIQTIPGSQTRIIDYPPPAFPVAHTFSVYGHVKFDNGTSIGGATVELYEPIDNTSMFNLSIPAIRSTVTDSSGNFQFTNVTTEHVLCGINVNLPVNEQYQMPLYFLTVNTTGVQHINITDSPLPNPELTSYPSQDSNAIVIGLGLGVVCLFGAFCLYKALYPKK
jgi:hypothetical protein